MVHSLAWSALFGLATKEFIKAFKVGGMSSSEFSETFDSGFKLFGEGNFPDESIVLIESGESGDGFEFFKACHELLTS